MTATPVGRARQESGRDIRREVRRANREEAFYTAPDAEHRVWAAYSIILAALKRQHPNVRDTHRGDVAQMLLDRARELDASLEQQKEVTRRDRRPARVE